METFSATLGPKIVDVDDGKLDRLVVQVWKLVAEQQADRPT